MEPTREQISDASDLMALCDDVPEEFKYQIKQRDLICTAILRYTTFRRVRLNCLIPQT